MRKENDSRGPGMLNNHCLRTMEHCPAGLNLGFLGLDYYPADYLGSFVVRISYFVHSPFLGLQATILITLVSWDNLVLDRPDRLEVFTV